MVIQDLIEVEILLLRRPQGLSLTHTLSLSDYRGLLRHPITCLEHDQPTSLEGRLA